MKSHLLPGKSWQMRKYGPSYSKLHTDMTRGLRHGTQFGMLMREELVTVCVGMHGDAGQVN